MKNTRTTTAAVLAALAGVNLNALEIPIGTQKVDVHGFASQGFLYSSDYNYLGKTTDGSAEFNEFGLNASISPFKRTRITAQAFTFDLGNVNNYDVFLDYASIEYTFNDYIGVRGGRVRRAGGIYNHIQDVDLARTSVLLPQGVYDARWRDFSTSIDGGLFFGNIPLGKAGGLSYEAYAGVMNLSDQGGVARMLQNGLPPAPLGNLDGIDQSVIAGTQLWWATPVQGLRLGLGAGQVFDFSWEVSLNPPVTPIPLTQKTISDIPFVQASAEYVRGNWTFQAEYYTYFTDTHDYIAGNLVGRAKGQPDTWYAGASYRFCKHFELGTYYSEYYADTSDRNGRLSAVESDAFQKDVALSARFDIKDWWIFKIEGHHINGTAQLQNNSQNPVRDDNGWWMLAAKTTFSF